MPVHFCDSCGERENGGIRSIGYIAKAIIEAARLENGDIDPAKVQTITWFNENITAGEIIIVPKTRGTFDGGAAITGAGYGDDGDEVTTGKNFSLVANDPDHKANEEFWNAMEKRTGAYHAIWRTGSQFRISDTPVNISVADPVEEGTETEVAWQVTTTWKQTRRRTVQVFDLAPVREIFECFEVTEDPEA